MNGLSIGKLRIGELGDNTRKYLERGEVKAQGR
jgi:hypothetical protein